LDRIAWLQGQGGQALLFCAADSKNADQARQANLLTASHLLMDYATGRVFDEQSEWRWQPDGVGEFSVLGLSEDEEAMHLGPTSAMLTGRHEWRVSETTWRLTGSIVSEGKHDPLATHTWFETRYPKPLIYPVIHGGDRQNRPRLDVRTYTDARGAVRFVRFCRLHVEKE
jgi:hypothetical protein